jgi:hypothetical protein
MTPNPISIRTIALSKYSDLPSRFFPQKSFYYYLLIIKTNELS